MSYIIVIIAGAATTTLAGLNVFWERKTNKKETCQKEIYKKIIALFLIIISGVCNTAIGVVALVNDTTSIQSSPVRDFEFERRGNTIVITGYRGRGGDVIIPNVINNRIVAEIAEGAFLGNENIESVVIQDGVTRIAARAFEGCTNLRAVTLPSTLQTLGQSAFRDCLRLESIDIPEGIKIISYSTFSGCSSLSEVNLPDSLEHINENAFRSCASLRSIALPQNIQSVHQNAFANCENLRVIFTDSTLMDLQRLGVPILRDDRVPDILE